MARTPRRGPKVPKVTPEGLSEAQRQALGGDRQNPQRSSRTYARFMRQRFAHEYVVDKNPVKAAIRAGFPPGACEQLGPWLAQHPEVRNYMDAMDARRGVATEVTAAAVLTELAVVGFSDMGHFVTVGDDGEVYLDLRTAPRHALRAVQEITQEVYMEGSGETARPVRRTRLKLYNKTQALGMIAQHYGMFLGLDAPADPSTDVERMRHTRQKFVEAIGRLVELRDITPAPGGNPASGDVVQALAQVLGTERLVRPDGGGEAPRNGNGHDPRPIVVQDRGDDFTVTGDPEDVDYDPDEQVPLPDDEDEGDD